MASAISYEYLQSILNQAEGLPVLDANTKILAEHLPDEMVTKYKGEFEDEAALIAAYPAATPSDYAYVTDTQSFWYWNAELSTAAWVNQQITATAYMALTTAQRAAVPYIIVP